MGWKILVWCESLQKGLSPLALENLVEVFPKYKVIYVEYCEKHLNIESMNLLSIERYNCPSAENGIVLYLVALWAIIFRHLRPLCQGCGL